MTNELKIEGYAPAAPGVYTRERQVLGMAVDPKTWKQTPTTKSVTDVLLVSISSIPTGRELLERIVEDAQLVVSDTMEGTLPGKNKAYTPLKIDIRSEYYPGQQVLLCMPYRTVQTLAECKPGSETEKGFLALAEMCHPLKELMDNLEREEQDDIDMIEIVYMPWETKTLAKSLQDKTDPQSYWDLLKPNVMMAMVPAFVVKEKIEDKEDVVERARQNNMLGKFGPALMEAIDAVYSCSPDELADRSPQKWNEATTLALIQMHGKLKEGTLNKINSERRALEEKSQALTAEIAEKAKKQLQEIVEDRVEERWFAQGEEHDRKLVGRATAALSKLKTYGIARKAEGYTRALSAFRFTD